MVINYVTPENDLSDKLQEILETKHFLHFWFGVGEECSVLSLINHK